MKELGSSPTFLFPETMWKREREASLSFESSRDSPRIPVRRLWWRAQAFKISDSVPWLFGVLFFLLFCSLVCFSVFAPFPRSFKAQYCRCVAGRDGLWVDGSPGVTAPASSHVCGHNTHNFLPPQRMAPAVGLICSDLIQKKTWTVTWPRKTGLRVL